jgi:hypothetical protein
MAKRAIYIDFEGFLGKAPSLIGVAIGSKFYQVALDEGLRLAAARSVRSGTCHQDLWAGPERNAASSPFAVRRICRIIIG